RIGEHALQHGLVAQLVEKARRMPPVARLLLRRAPAMVEPARNRSLEVGERRLAAELRPGREKTRLGRALVPIVERVSPLLDEGDDFAPQSLQSLSFQMLADKQEHKNAHNEAKPDRSADRLERTPLAPLPDSLPSRRAPRPDRLAGAETAQVVRQVPRR